MSRVLEMSPKELRAKDTHKMTEEQLIENVRVAKAILTFLAHHDHLAMDVLVYFNGLRVRPALIHPSTGEVYKEEVIEIGYWANEYFDFATAEGVSMSFEGALYNVLNYYEGDLLLEEFKKMLEDLGYYYELGNSWNCNIVKI